MMLPSFQSEVTLVPYKYFAIFSGLVSAYHTFSAGAAMVTFASAVAGYDDVLHYHLCQYRFIPEDLFDNFNLIGVNCFFACSKMQRISKLGVAFP